MSEKKSLRNVFIFLLILSWVFQYPPINFGGQGWPRIWNFPPEVQQARAAETRIFITSTASTTWTVPSDWNNSSNTIEVIGGGGGGGNSADLGDGGGGGGAYAKISNFNVGASTTILIQVGKGGTQNVSGTISFWGGSGATSTCTGKSVCAQFGGRGINATAGPGGASSTSVGSTTYKGGNGGTGNTNGDTGGGGGGAAGPLGNGANGGNGGGSTSSGGGGGGGSGGGSVGQNASSSGGTGGRGGDGPGGTGGGAGGNTGDGSPATAGSGGGGGGGDQDFNGDDGATYTEWDSTHGSGGGGGGGADLCELAVDGAGALYGGGGGGADCGGGPGANGIIVITYTPPPTYEQSAFRWFRNENATSVGGSLTSSQDASTTITDANPDVRLRMLLHVGTATSTATTTTAFKLQVATSTPGGCDPSYSGETYADVATSTGDIRYKNNTTPADEALLTSSGDDPTHGGHSIVNQTYQEENNFFVTSTISAGADGKWDFALTLAPTSTLGQTYCFRTVFSSGTLITTSTLTKIPELTTTSTTQAVQRIGFELNDKVTENLASTNNALITTSTNPISGTYSALNDANSVARNFYYIYANNDVTTRNTFMSFTFKITTLPTAQDEIAVIASTGALNRAFIKLNTDGTLELWNATAAVGASSTAINDGATHRIDIRYDNTPASGSHILEARLDGVSFASSSAQSLGSQGRGYIGRRNSSAGSPTYMWDDWYIGDDSGTEDTGYPNIKEKIVVLRPNASGTNNAWLKSGGGAGDADNYQEVDEVTPDDATTYLKITTSTSAIDDYNLPALSTVGINASDTITRIDVGIRFFALTSASADSIVTRITSGASTDESGDLVDTVADTWNTNQEGTGVKHYPLFANNSNYEKPGTNTDWTPSNLDSAQIGIYGLVTDEELRVSTLWLQIAYVPTGNSAPTVSGVSLNNGSAIVLTPNATTSVRVNFTVTDNDGCSDVFTNGSIEVTVNRTGAGATNSCTLNDLNCYRVSTSTNNCSGGSSANATSTVDIYYFAQATDASSSFASETWRAFVLATDASNATGTSSSTAELNTLVAIDVAPASINYGTVTASSTSGSVNQTSTIKNAGNATTTLQISGKALTLGANSIATSSQRYATSTFTVGASEQQLSGTATDVSGLSIPGPPMGRWQETQALPNALSEMASAAYNGYVYSIGGAPDGSGATTSVWYSQIAASGTLGSWTAGTALPGSLRDVPAVAYNDYLYTIGGYNGSVATSSVYYASVNTSTGALGSWLNATVLPSNILFNGAAAYNGYLYSVGGEVSLGSQTTTVRYAQINATGSISSWTNTTALPGNRSRYVVVVSDGYIYALGGAILGGATSSVIYAPLNANGTVGSWLTANALPTSTQRLGAVVASNMLYVVGGNTPSAATTTVIFAAQNASGSLGVWTQSPFSLPTAQNDQGLAVDRGFMYQLGGAGTITSTVLYAPIVNRPIFWGISVPAGTATGTYTGQNTFTSVFSP